MFLNLHLLEDFLHLDTLREVLVQIEEVLELEFGNGQHVRFARGQSRHI